MNARWFYSLILLNLAVHNFEHLLDLLYLLVVTAAARVADSTRQR